MYCFVFWKIKRTQDICLSCLRADVSYFVCCTRATKEIGDVCTQATASVKRLSLFSCGWKYFEICQGVSSLFLFSPTTFAFVIVKSEKNYIIILSKIQ